MFERSLSIFYGPKFSEHRAKDHQVVDRASKIRECEIASLSEASCKQDGQSEKGDARENGFVFEETSIVEEDVGPKGGGEDKARNAELKKIDSEGNVHRDIASEVGV